MSGFFERLRGKGKGSTVNSEALGEALFELQRAYWTPAPDEKQKLLSATIEGLSWRELLRLHHLVCLDLLHAAGFTTAGQADLAKMLEAPEGPDAELCPKLAERLRGPSSPYRPRLAHVFQRGSGCSLEQPSQQREAEQRGELCNASLTHIGAIEVIKLEGERPVALDFVPFEALHAIHIGTPSLFPPARLEFEEAGRAEVVCLPLLYGPSWFTPEPTDRDGTMTRFVCHVREAAAGIGIGHQDLTTGEKLFGLGSIEAIEFPRRAAQASA